MTHLIGRRGEVGLAITLALSPLNSADGKASTNCHPHPAPTTIAMTWISKAITLFGGLLLAHA